MYSLTKTPLLITDAQEIVSFHFGSSVNITDFQELTGGFYNSAYLLQISDRTKWVIKISPHPSVNVMRYEKDILRAEVEVLNLVKARTDLQVPAIVINDYTHSILKNDYFIMEFIGGVPLNKIRELLTEAEAKDIDKKTGQMLRIMNSIKGDQFGYFSHPELPETSWHETFEKMIRGVLLDGQEKGVPLPYSYDEILWRTSSHFSALDEVVTPQLVHWDLWDGNIFIDPATRQITGLIDFERAMWADPLMEANFGAFGMNPDFLAGYGHEMLGTKNRQKRRSIYNIYLYLIMVIECYFRNYENDQQEKWARQKLFDELELLAT